MQSQDDDEGDQGAGAPGPRAPWLALAMAAGIAVAVASGRFAAAPLPWAAAAMLAALVVASDSERLRPKTRSGSERRWRRSARWLLVVCLAGAALAARERAAEQAVALPAGAVADDRDADDLEGLVRGPVELVRGADADGASQRFVLALAAPGRGDVVVTAAGAPPIEPGDRVRVSGRARRPRGFRVPGAADAAQIARDLGGALLVSASAGEVSVVVAAAQASLWRSARSAQRAIAARIAARGGDPEGNALVRAMVAGDRSAVAPEVDDRFRDAGVYHALSVSGLHLAVVALFAFALVRRAWAAVAPLAVRIDAAVAAALVAAPLAIGYTMITGAETATLRSLVVVLIVLAGLATARRARVIDALGVAALALLALRPSALFDPSFQLSFVACATLALASGGGDAPTPARGRSRARRVAAWALARLRAAVVASLWVGLATAPITALHFHQVSWGGVVGNLIVLPVLELVVLPVGLLGVLLAGAMPTAGGALIDVAIAASGWADDAIAAIAVQTPSLRVSPPGGPELAAAALVWVVALAWRRRWLTGRRAGWAALSALALFAGARVLACLSAGSGDELRITFLDVGQGDAAVIELPGGAVWLVDAGGAPFSGGPEVSLAERRRVGERPGAESVLRFLEARHIHAIDVVAISHLHPDHLLGLGPVVRAIPVGELWLAEPPDGDEDGPALDPAMAAVLEEALAHGVRIVHPPLGLARAIGDVSVRVLAPWYQGELAAGDPVRSVNDNSLVLSFERAGRTVLFTGDLEREGEEVLVAAAAARGESLAADVVKVAHHGSPTSSHRELISAIAARFAVISCGVGNRFGFPDEAVVARWTAAGAEVLRTDQVGAITVVIDRGGALHASTFDPR